MVESQVHPLPVVPDKKIHDLRILLVEDSPADARLVQEYLEQASPIFPTRLTWTKRLCDGVDALRSQWFDLILLDLELPDSSESEGLARLQKVTTVPIVVLCGSEDDALAERLVKQGAEECFPKGHLSSILLRRLIRHAIERRKLRAKVHELSHSVARFDKLESIGQLASGLAHELRHPLTTLTLVVDQLADTVSADHIEVMNRSLQRASKIVSSLLDYASEKPFEPVPTSVDEVLSDTLKLVSHEIEANGVSLSVEIQEDLVTPSIDASRIEQVLVNLIRNSIQATLSSPETPKIKVSAANNGRAVQICVEDNGQGIAEADYPKVFDPFFSTKRKGEGTGLGLTVSRELVELHGGLLSIASLDSPLHGCIATIELPLFEE